MTSENLIQISPQPVKGLDLYHTAKIAKDKKKIKKKNNARGFFDMDIDDIISSDDET